MSSNDKFGKKSCPKITYLDNNATTLICPQSKKIHNEWLSCYNASSDSKIARPAKQLLERATDTILSHCNVSTATHTVVFTSGASESNCLIIRSCCKAYKKRLTSVNDNIKPHIICSAVEHHSTIECINDLVECNQAEVSYVEPTIYGNIMPEDIERCIKPNT